MQLPAHLNTGQALGLIAGEPIAQYELGSMRNFIYLILDSKTKTAAIVDPQKDLTPVVELEAMGYHLERILLTHTHHDHVAGVPELLVRFPELPVYVHEADIHRLKNVPEKNLRRVVDGDCFTLGEVSIKAIHSPGHSAGEITYHVRTESENPEYLLTGDTLFIRDCGRTDFPDGSDEEMFKTLERLKTLPDSTIILPGHHYAPETASFLGTEKKMSPPLKCRNAAELAALN